MSKAARHLKAKHSEEPEVKLAKATEKRGKNQRSPEFEKLRLQGNFYHNMKTITTGVGSLIVVRTPSSGIFETSDYLPCPYCLGFFIHCDLWRHKQQCLFKSERQSEGGETTCSYSKIQQESQMIMQPFMQTAGTTDDLFNQYVLSTMVHDQISLVVKNDSLITAFGRSLLDKVGRQRSQYISQRLRQLGRLLITLRSLKGEIEGPSLADFLKPELFDLVVSGVMKLAQKTEGSNGSEYGVPSLSLKLGHSLKKCILILRGMALRQRDSSLGEQCKLYLELHESEWSDKVSSHALSTMVKRKANTPDVLPVTSDLIKLKQFMKEESHRCVAAIKECPSPETWTALVDVTLGRIILFNKRRSGEAAKLLIKSYDERPVWKDFANEEISNSLSSLEKQLSNR